MTDAEDFSHGSYGDYSGVVFYGPPTDGFWLDRLAVSDRYINPLFSAVLGRSWAASSGERTPQLVRDWQQLDGWTAAGKIVELQKGQVGELLGALAGITAPDLIAYCYGSTAEDCLRCANAIKQFLVERLARGVNLFIDRE